MSKHPKSKKLSQKTDGHTRLKRETVKNQQKGNNSFVDLLECHLGKYHNIYIVIIVILSVLFSFLSFDIKTSIANDDAMYIEAGARYARDFFGYFYTHNAPLYPIILSLFIKIIGVKLFWLKVLSIIFFSTSIYFIFIGFKDRIPYIILLPSLFLTAINSEFLVYASLTYTETFSLMVFAIGFILFFKVFDKFEQPDYTLQKNFLYFILLGFICFVFMLTRSVALATIGILIAFFIYRKKYIESILSLGSFVAFYFLYNILLEHIWHLDKSQFSNQAGAMFNKDYYQPQLGKETLWGFVMRFWENSQIYISSRLYFILGFREEMSSNDMALTLITSGLFLWSLYLMFKKKMYALFFSSLFFIGLLAATFISLHTSWGQSRLIMLYLPFIFFNIFYLLYYYGEKVKVIQYIFAAVFSIFCISSLVATFKQVGEKFPVFNENMTGDPTYGYTPDWQNYIKMTNWCVQHLPDETKSIAVRKAPMSFIFSEGKEFYGIYNTPTDDADSLLMPLEKANVKYLMLSELRLNPNRYIKGQVVSTMHRYAYLIQQKYPEAFEFVHQEGEFEVAQLYKIKYDYIDSLRATFN